MSCNKGGGVRVGWCSSEGGMEKIVVDLMETQTPNMLQKLLNH